MKGSYYQDTDQLSAWAISGSSSSLVPQTGTQDISAKGLGLFYNGERIITVDTGYSTWGSKTLYYREFGMGISYPTTPAPGTTTWIERQLRLKTKFLLLISGTIGLRHRKATESTTG
ncbi:MAG: hypothetical protein CM15mP9_3810 [Methanobacteriota archaeon]|nr:MAG: hypothetical protein CM15mP9_3810 [Euryarchaeota archaeon]